MTSASGTLFDRLVLAARIVLGVFYLLSGLNWFFGFIPMLPHVGMPADLRIKHMLVVEMINTGWFFQAAKIMEIAFGVSLLANRAVPLLLAATLPVAFITFMLDALILDDIARWLGGTQDTPALLAAVADMIVGGLCVLLPHLWLMLCYRDYYRPAFAWRASPQWGGQPAEPGLLPEHPLARPAGFRPGRALILFGGFAVLLQIYNLYLFVSMIRLG
ncbi:hypothetical protein [Sphingomonas hengshuiensis]|uniref:Uncharacterized protein n=1 Tax=Sphingomonas hengshuiensis TaxID=1609977 RepID=A0A7U4J949_9SPHN|nr:hypothetical protein [Sphingomonas hengshuiensis]AJP72535.1 hypothetical protein TS85_13255 [Sphingomonas hengshuiensis]